MVGAGPAGVAAATTLARAGLDVAMIDRATFPRDKVCGDGLTSLALGLLEDLGLEPEMVSNWQWTSDCWVRSPSGRTVRFELPSGQGHFAAIAPRIDLDTAMVDLARSVGVDIFEGSPVVAAAEDADGVEVRTDGDGLFVAPWAIAADGMWSPMRKHLHIAPDGYLGEWHAFRQYASGVTGTGARDMYVSFEADLLPGYFWSFPLPGGRANVGFGIQRGGKLAVRDMGSTWSDLLSRDHIRDVLGAGATLEGQHRAWPIPARIDTADAATSRTMFVGDAVGACDVMTGEGIGQALLSGRLAAEAVIGAGHGSGAATQYAGTVRRELAADHRMSMMLVRALRHRKGARAAVRVASATSWTRRNFARWLFEDYPRALVATPRRWPQHSLRGPGSYRDAAPQQTSA